MVQSVLSSSQEQMIFLLRAAATSHLDPFSQVINLALVSHFSLARTRLEPSISPAMEQAQSPPTADAVKPSQSRTLRSRLGEDVTVQNADSLLLLCCLVSGLTDSTIYIGRNHSVNGPSWLL